MFTSVFLKAAAERAAKTFVQALVAFEVANQANLFHANWSGALITAVGAAVASVVTSVLSTFKGNSNSPSLVDEQN